MPIPSKDFNSLRFENSLIIQRCNHLNALRYRGENEEVSELENNTSLSDYNQNEDKHCQVPVSLNPRLVQKGIRTLIKLGQKDILSKQRKQMV